VSGPFFRWSWIGDNRDLIWTQAVEHVQLTIIAVAIGFAISFPLAVFAHRHRRAYGPIAGFAGVVYTIPSLALFAFVGSFAGYFSITTAEVGLVGYTLLILIRNIVAGLGSVPADVSEAATGMGLSRRQLLWRVELPLALPAVVAGLRIATVTTIGLVTVTALIGKGGLGLLMLRGLSRFFPTSIVVGAVLSMALAVATDRLLVVVERRLTPWAERTATSLAA
jgi:osmoprotectant transport system permease protein